jgi:peptidoglycan/xylan/chitin deacetylase (PgdA/CDA1 family)
MVFSRLQRFLGRMVPVRPVQLTGDRPIASITFDDFPKSAWEEGGPLLARHNVRGTYYTAGTFCGRTVEGIPYYDEADLTALAQAGHEIACHGFGHRPTPTLSTEGLAADAARNAAFLKPFLNGGAPESYAFPYGALSPRTKRFYASRFTNVRGVHPGLNIGKTDLAQLNVVSIEKRSWNRDGIADAIARTKAGKGWIIFYTHDVSGDPTEYGSTPAMLAETLDRIMAAGIDILPMNEAVKVMVA